MSAYSEHVLRLARILAAAIELFGGDRRKAAEWMTMPVPELSGRIPHHMAASGSEYLQVLAHLESCAARRSAEQAVVEAVELP